MLNSNYEQIKTVIKNPINVPIGTLLVLITPFSKFLFSKNFVMSPTSNAETGLVYCQIN
jgi:hypothetical protein